MGTTIRSSREMSRVMQESVPRTIRPFGSRCSMVTVAGVVLVSIGLADNAQAQSDPLPSPPVVDLHVDLPWALYGHGDRLADPRLATNAVRLRRGNVGMLVLPLYVHDGWKRPPGQVLADYCATYETMMNAIRSQPASGALAQPGQAASPGRVQTMFAFEGADGFSADPEGIAAWIAGGACLVGLVHSHTNALAGGSMDPDLAKRTVGLTELGKRLARVVYRSGGLVDLAHMTDAAMRDTALIAAEFGAPLVDTHTGMRSLRPIDRNIDDTFLRAIRDSNGVVGVDIHSGHVARVAGAVARLDDVVRHIEHAVRVAGGEHVAIGSDLNGGIEQPSDADGAATWPRLARKLREKGWGDAQVSALFEGNAQRVLGWASAHGCGKAQVHGRAQ